MSRFSWGSGSETRWTDIRVQKGYKIRKCIRKKGKVNVAVQKKKRREEVRKVSARTAARKMNAKSAAPVSSGSEEMSRKCICE
jgi:hypothetical protein